MSSGGSFIKSPMFRWVVVGVLALGGLFLLIRSVGSIGRSETVADLKSDVTITDSETGDTWTMTRGTMESELLLRANEGRLDPATGFANPTTGTKTGFPPDWAELVERIRREVAESKEK